jgi:hypothetical protein
LRTGYLMTGDVRDPEDLVQETFLRVARRWNRVRSMDHPAAYARRILINLVLDDAGRRSRQQAELGPQDGGFEAADESATRALREVDDLAEFRWARLSCLRGSGPCWCCATGRTCPSPRSRRSSAAQPRTTDCDQEPFRRWAGRLPLAGNDDHRAGRVMRDLSAHRAR